KSVTRVVHCHGRLLEVVSAEQTDRTVADVLPLKKEEQNEQEHYARRRQRCEHDPDDALQLVQRCRRGRMHLDGGGPRAATGLITAQGSVRWRYRDSDRWSRRLRGGFELLLKVFQC